MNPPLRTVFPFAHDEQFAHTYLLEGGRTAQFSWKMKLYYQLVRPILPLPLRHVLQKLVGKSRTVNENFIWEEAIDVLKRGLADPASLGQGVFEGGLSTAIVLTHDVEDLPGYQFIPEVIALEARYGFVSSWNIVPYKYAISSDVLALIAASGHELGIHGDNHDGKLFYSKQTFDGRVRLINQAIHKYQAVGFRSPMVHRNLAWMQALDIQYDASCFDYDPLQPQPGGVGVLWPFMAGKFVELPYTLPQDHDLFYMLKLRNVDVWKRKIDFIVRNNGMILLNTHPDYLKDADHLKLYEETLAYLADIPGAWRGLPRQMAAHWKASYGS
jgi:peptidoglycan/xylan/chitin deacetylase (PgdA/CDA1 family)